MKKCQCNCNLPSVQKKAGHIIFTTEAGYMQLKGLFQETFKAELKKINDFAISVNDRLRDVSTCHGSTYDSERYHLFCAMDNIQNLIGEVYYSNFLSYSSSSI